MKRAARFLWRGFCFVVLTALTQVGGLWYLAALSIRTMLPLRFRRSTLALILLFGVIYAGTWPMVERVALFAGRAAVPCAGEGVLRVALPQVFCVLHRHYVSPQMLGVLNELANDLAQRFPGTVTLTLDANFPFLDGFPLLPHLSHDDGDKVDLAYFYASMASAYIPGQIASPFGYWAFAPNRANFDVCPDRQWLTLRWDMAWLQPFMRRDLLPDDVRNRALLDWVVSKGRASGLGRVLVEPHFAVALGFDDHQIIGFQGCRAARHDDHIHLQL